MWDNIEKLTFHLNQGAIFKHQGIAFRSEIKILRSEDVTRNEVLRRIEILVQDIVQQISVKKSPVLRYNNRDTWGNISFTEGVGLEMKREATYSELKFETVTSRYRFALTMKVLAMCYNLVQSNSYSTKRELYYNDTQSFTNQAVLDSIVDNISCILRVPRYSLHVLSTSKGCIAGDLQYTEVDGNHVDCSTSRTGSLVPAQVNGISKKDASFQKLLDEGITERLHPCIVMTGRGFPDLSTRQMLRKLWDTLRIPVLALVDADPFGLEILLVYKYGSRSQSLDSHNLTVPSIRWLGILPSDLKRLHVPQEVLIPLCKSDLDKAREIMKRPYYTTLPLWMKEVQMMLDSGFKAEIQSLSAISRNFLTDVYIPSKIKCGGWI